MEEFMYNMIVDKHYLGIVTILDYEQPLQKILSNIDICKDIKNEKKILIDLVLKSGMNKYRFVEYNITNDGKIIESNFSYVAPNKSIVKLANSFIMKKREFLKYSVLSSSTKEKILNS